jgi:hypothetical protein
MKPPSNPTDVAYHVNLYHREGGTWSALEATPAAALASAEQKYVRCAQLYTAMGFVSKCSVSETNIGLVWKLSY